MILLDTNVVSEGLRPQPSMRVKAWTDSQRHSTLYLCTPVVAELRFGLERLGDGRRKSDLRRGIDKVENDLFLGRILPFDLASAHEYSLLMVDRQRKGRPIDLMDGLVAAIARSQGASLATRNTNHFIDLGIDLINPFEAPT
jgi:toxin FitB